MTLKIAADISLVQVELHKVSIAVIIKLQKVEMLVTKAGIFEQSLYHKSVKIQQHNNQYEGQDPIDLELDLKDCKIHPKNEAYTNLSVKKEII